MRFKSVEIVNPLKKPVSRPKRSDKKYGRISAILTCISVALLIFWAPSIFTAFAGLVHRTAIRRLTYPNLGRARDDQDRHKKRRRARLPNSLCLLLLRLTCSCWHSSAVSSSCVCLSLCALRSP